MSCRTFWLVLAGMSLCAAPIFAQDALPGQKGTQAQVAEAKPAKAKSIQGRPTLKWNEKIHWKNWSDARFEAAEKGKAICLVLYTDWCPRCRDLMPVFNDPKVEAAAQGLVMVKQNQDHRPEWLRQFSELGGYVPRVFFFGVDGELRRDITSGNSRYPYYYTQGGVDSLLRSMKKAGAK